MYLNLEAEIARHQIKKPEMAAAIGKNYITLTQKISGKKPFFLEEALKIQETFFPDLDIKYLFSRSA